MFDSIKLWFSGLLGNTAYHLVPALIQLLVGILIIKSVMKLAAGALNKSKLEKAAHRLILNVLKVILYGLLALIVARALGVDVTGVVALASVLTLAVSLSLQSALSNLFGGFSLLYNKPFVSGDVVEIAGKTGTVREIDLTYTKLVTPDNKIISIPNSSVVSAQIVNYSTAGTRRVELTVTASYDAPTEKVLEALRLAGKVPTSLEDPAPFAGIKSFGESSIEYALNVWTKCDDYWTTYFDVNKNVREVFHAEGIEMTYPHLNVHLDK